MIRFGYGKGVQRGVFAEFEFIVKASRNSLGVIASLAFAMFGIAGCQQAQAPAKPEIEITVAPAAQIGGPSQMEPIAGRVSHARPGQQIILYARSGVWWIQPLANQPFTRIEPDSTWKNTTHLGSEYAALLVDPGYSPGSKLITLPGQGNGVAAVAVVKGKPGTPNALSTLHFSGYDWAVRAAGSDRGGEANAYDPRNAWVDAQGHLHLRMMERDGQWTCAEVSLTRSLGYGMYRFPIEDTSRLRPSAVAGIFTWDESRSEGTRNELDIELSRWGDAKLKNAQYVIQPFYEPENLARFMAPAGVLTHEFRWSPESVAFKTTRDGGRPRQDDLVSEHVFTAGLPKPASETVHIDLYDFHHGEGGSREPAEVVIDRFEYHP
jgi:hypothetical protein